MDNLANILSVSIQPGLFQPCIRVHRASEVAARDYGARYQLEMTFSYTSNGTQQTVSSTQNVSATTLIAQIDSRWDRVHGQNVGVRAAPDPHTNMNATVMMVLLNAAGVRIETSDAVTTIIPVP